MKLRRLLYRTLAVLAVLLLLLAMVAGGFWWYFHPSFQQTSGIIYAKRAGQDVTFDILRPARPKATSTNNLIQSVGVL